MEDNLMTLTTEERNPRTMDMSHMEAGEIAAVMNEEDYRCAAAVKEALPQIVNVINTCISTILGGGRVFFIGAAHSGYLGLLDGYETNATFGTENQFIPIVAGHFSDIMKTEGGAEDSAESGKADLEAYGIDEKDYCIGLSASGRTPYPIGALTYARECGTRTAAIINNHDTLLGRVADDVVELVAGAEVITGSTRLKAGTCMKMALNMITTVTMVKLGKVYSNLMIEVPPVSDKMRKRLLYILQQASGCTKERAKELMEETEYDIKLALLMEKKSIGLEQAIKVFEECGGDINRVI